MKHPLTSFLLARPSRSWLACMVCATLTMVAAAHPSPSEPASQPAGETRVIQLFARPIAECPGQSMTLLQVSYAPGASTPPHRHSGSVYVYVLSGVVEMQIKGGPLVTLREGQTFFEEPGAVHLVSRNADACKPATFLAYLIGPTDQPTTQSVDESGSH